MRFGIALIMLVAFSVVSPPADANGIPFNPFVIGQLMNEFGRMGHSYRQPGYYRPHERLCKTWRNGVYVGIEPCRY